MERINLPAPTLEIVNGEPTVLSTVVAKYFQKNHFDVLRQVDGLLRRNNDLTRLRYFTETFISRPNPNNPDVSIRSRAYRMNRCGFEILAMKMSGRRAERFQIQFAQAFEAAVKALENLNSSALHEAMRLEAKFDSRKSQICFCASNLAKWKYEKQTLLLELDEAKKRLQPELPFDQIVIKVKN